MLSAFGSRPVSAAPLLSSAPALRAPVDHRVGHDVEAALDVAELLLIERRLTRRRAQPDLAPEPDHRDIVLVLAELGIELGAQRPAVGPFAERSLSAIPQR